jgi:hypothetical protein
MNEWGLKHEFDQWSSCNRFLAMEFDLLIIFYKFYAMVTWMIKSLEILFDGWKSGVKVDCRWRSAQMLALDEDPISLISWMITRMSRTLATRITAFVDDVP